MLEMVEAAQIRINLCLTSTPHVSLSRGKLRMKPTKSKARTWKISAVASSAWPCNQAVGGQLLPPIEKCRNNEGRDTTKKRVFFLDVNPLCYAGSTPSLHAFAHWISLFFCQVSHNNPVIAVSSLSPSLYRYMYAYPSLKMFIDCIQVK
ncbi:hypothetical protein L1049_025471 [Liquidambar formosana]|uniref:Uncharacterized protein n=1 Tax=Liquidambar formosana TaxID=63359 RepID=A0AAP0NBH2_LIQFO